MEKGKLRTDIIIFFTLGVKALLWARRSYPQKYQRLQGDFEYDQNITWA